MHVLQNRVSRMHRKCDLGHNSKVRRDSSAVCFSFTACRANIATNAYRMRRRSFLVLSNARYEICQGAEHIQYLEHLLTYFGLVKVIGLHMHFRVVSLMVQVTPPFPRLVSSWSRQGEFRGEFGVNRVQSVCLRARAFDTAMLGLFGAGTTREPIHSLRVGSDTGRVPHASSIWGLDKSVGQAALHVLGPRLPEPHRTQPEKKLTGMLGSSHLDTGGVEERRAVPLEKHLPGQSRSRLSYFCFPSSSEISEPEKRLPLEESSG